MEANWVRGLMRDNGECYGAFYAPQALKPPFETGRLRRGVCGGRLTLVALDDEIKCSGFMTLQLACCSPDLVAAAPAVRAALEANGLVLETFAEASGRSTVGLSFKHEDNAFEKRLLQKMPWAFEDGGRVGGDEFEWSEAVFQAQSDAAVDEVLRTLVITEFHVGDPFERADVHFDHFFFKYVLQTECYELKADLKAAGLDHPHERIDGRKRRKGAKACTCDYCTPPVEAPSFAFCDSSSSDEFEHALFCDDSD
ncbi:hypothetical protein M885DRAFT_566125 [Pelagophyceae sp. CCMP2097]|nr:hypothetical protein M885DRAFT_566125 [Pelagophyceae sp. CCMP2097]